eukprot:gene25602-30918_t
MTLIDTRGYPSHTFKALKQQIRQVLPHATVISSLPQVARGQAHHLHAGGIIVIINMANPQISQPHTDPSQCGSLIQFNLLAPLKISISAVYMPVNSKNVEGSVRLFTRLQNFLTSTGNPLSPHNYLRHLLMQWQIRHADSVLHVVMGDLNCDARAWSRLHLEDQGWSPASPRVTYERNDRSSIIDFILHSRSRLPANVRVTYAHTVNDPDLRANSDHLPVLKDIHIQSNEQEGSSNQQRRRRNRQARNENPTATLPSLNFSDQSILENFQAVITAELERLSDLQDPNTAEEAEELLNRTVTIIQKSIFELHSKKKKRCAHWKKGWSAAFHYLLAKLRFLVSLNRILHTAFRRARRITDTRVRAIRRHLSRRWKEISPPTGFADATGPSYWSNLPVNELTVELCSTEYEKTRRRMHGRSRLLYAGIDNTTWNAQKNNLRQIYDTVLDERKTALDLDTLLVPGDERLLTDPSEIHFACAQYGQSYYSLKSHSPLEELGDNVWNWNWDDFLRVCLEHLPPKLHHTITPLWNGFRCTNKETEAAHVKNQLLLLPEVPSREAFLHAIGQSKKKTSAGPSGLSFQTLQAIPDIAKNILYNCLQLLWTNDVLPQMFLNRMVCYVPKAGCAAEMQSMRPIMLLECLRKLWVGLITKPAFELVDSSGLLSDTQWGYRSRRSTFIPALGVIDALEHSSLNKEAKLFLSSWDFTKAFDSVLPYMRRLALIRIGLPIQLVKLLDRLDTEGRAIPKTPYALATLHEFLSSPDRQGDNTLLPSNLAHFKMGQGIGQGDVTSAHLWNLLVDPLLAALSSASSASNSIGAELRGEFIINLIKFFADDSLSNKPSFETLQLEADFICAFAILAGPAEYGEAEEGWAMMTAEEWAEATTAG